MLKLHILLGGPQSNHLHYHVAMAGRSLSQYDLRTNITANQN